MGDKKPVFGDAVIILVVLALAVGIAAPWIREPMNTLYCEVRQDRETVRSVKLAEGYVETFTVENAHGGQNTIEIDGKRVRISTATCADAVCVQTGWLTRAGQSAVCLPNRVIVKLTGAKQDTVDAIAGSVGG